MAGIPGYFGNKKSKNSLLKTRANSKQNKQLKISSDSYWESIVREVQISNKVQKNNKQI